MLIEKLLEKVFVTTKTIDGKEFKHIDNVEFYISPDCNLKCSYCYVQKHKDLTYPKEIRDPKVIMGNLKLLLRAIEANSIYIHTLDIFSGEIWSSDFGIQSLVEILEFNKKNRFCDKILIPSNCEFVLHPEWRNKFQNLIDQFKELGINLLVSASIDGPLIDPVSRAPVSSNHRSLDDYDVIFEFLSRNGYLTHPMLSPDSVPNWIETHKWFSEMHKKFNMNPHIMILEVRDGDWNDEILESYKKYIEYLFNYELNSIYEGSLLKLANDKLFWFNESYPHGYNSLKLSNFRRMSCKLQRTIYIRLGDLSIIPCHRLSYDKLNYGKIQIDDDLNITITDQNVELAIKLLSTRFQTGINGCDSCEDNYFCLGPCLGANYEYHWDVAYTCTRKVCNMQKTRIRTVSRLFLDSGLEELVLSDQICSSNRNKEMEVLKNLLKEAALCKEDFNV